MYQTLVNLCLRVLKYESEREPRSWPGPHGMGLIPEAAKASSGSRKLAQPVRRPPHTTCIALIRVQRALPRACLPPLLLRVAASFAQHCNCNVCLNRHLQLCVLSAQRRAVAEHSPSVTSHVLRSRVCRVTRRKLSHNSPLGGGCVSEACVFVCVLRECSGRRKYVECNVVIWGASQNRSEEEQHAWH